MLIVIFIVIFFEVVVGCVRCVSEKSKNAVLVVILVRIFISLGKTALQ